VNGAAGAVDAIDLIFTVWQQRRADRIASVRPEQEV